MSLHISKGSTFVDRDDNIKTFTNVDWSKKTQSGPVPLTPEEKKALLDSLSEYRTSLIKRLFAINPFYIMREFPQFVIRHEKGLQWNGAMVSDEGMDIDTLQFMLTIAENKQELEPPQV